MGKFHSLFKALILVSLAFISHQVKAQTFYDINTIQKIELTFTQSNWDYLLDTAKAGDETYLMASVIINGTPFDSVGVKYKGNSTYNANQKKNPLHIELDTYKDQNYEGFKDIKLSNVAKDPSYLREVLSYSILRKYMFAPMSNYANVYINGELFGLYVSSEAVGKTFIKKYFNSSGNAFFKCNPVDGAGPGTNATPNLVYKGNDSASYSEAYEIKSDYGWNELINLCNTLKNDVGNIENILDVDRALWMIAFDNVTVNLDSYIGGFAQNYYLYKDNSGRFSPIIWDLNEGFGTFSQTGTINLQNTTSKIQMTHLLHSGDANWPLVNKLLGIPSYKKMYLAHYYTILKENFSNSSFIDLGVSIQPIINASVQADPNRFFTYSQYTTNIYTDITSGGGPGASSTPGLKNLMDNRYTYMAALADFTNTKPSISIVQPSTAMPFINKKVTIKATVTNTNAVYLAYRSNRTDKFTKVQMYDDGSHNDGTANDNIYGAEFTVETELTDYYIYAENSNVGMFSPERAEHEFYNLTATNEVALDSPILINEIYSRGTAEAPDWIELYNTSDAEVDLSGYKIFDSGGQSGSKDKKSISAGITIPAKGYYVIITDDDKESAFGLSSSGETVWLENSNGSVVDQIGFPPHTESQSYGRLPNGGDWQLLDSITRGTANSMKKTDNEVETSPILMNEIYSRGTAEAPDWIELFNTSDANVDISGYKIYDSGGQSGSKAKKLIPASTIIPAKGYYVIVVDDDDESGFGLSSSGESVWLETAKGTIIDEIAYIAHTEDGSYGRLSNGGDWQLLDSITRGTSNAMKFDDEVETSPILMNEIYSRGTAEAPDWIELFNTSDANVDISGYKIYDSGGESGSKAKKLIPASTIIPANGYYVVIVDDDDESGFGLSGSGESVWLETAKGTVIDEIAFGALTESQSYGRYPNGSDWKLLDSITRGTSNAMKITSIDDLTYASDDFGLRNYPNPFAISTTIEFNLLKEDFVSLNLYNSLGELTINVFEGFLNAGIHQYQLNNPNLANGMYYYKLNTNTNSIIKSMIILK